MRIIFIANASFQDSYKSKTYKKRTERHRKQICFRNLAFSIQQTRSIGNLFAPPSTKSLRGMSRLVPWPATLEEVSASVRYFKENSTAVSSVWNSAQFWPERAGQLSITVSKNRSTNWRWPG